MSAPALGSPATGRSAPPWRLARFLRASLGRLLVTLYRTRIIGADNLPSDGGYVLAGNHVSYLDPALLWCVAPRPTHFMAKQELFDKPIIGWGLARLWAFPISRGVADREAIQRATALLKAGETVGIFPEGTRQTAGAGEVAGMGEAHQGVSFIAMRADVPVVPVAIAGTEKALPRGAKLPRFPRVTIRYGQPIRSEEFVQAGRRERMGAMTAEVMRRIAREHRLAEEA